jgi:hypothetical protein
VYCVLVVSSSLFCLPFSTVEPGFKLLQVFCMSGGVWCSESCSQRAACVFRLIDGIFQHHRTVQYAQSVRNAVEIYDQIYGVKENEKPCAVRRAGFPTRDWTPPRRRRVPGFYSGTQLVLINLEQTPISWLEARSKLATVCRRVYLFVVVLSWILCQPRL